MSEIIRFKGRTIAFYTKGDLIEKNPFVEVPELHWEKRRFDFVRRLDAFSPERQKKIYKKEEADTSRSGDFMKNGDGLTRVRRLLFSIGRDHGYVAV